MSAEATEDKTAKATAPSYNQTLMFLKETKS